MAYERLEKLGEERFESLKKDLLEGVSPFTLAKKIQGEWGEFSDVSENTLGQQLRRFKMALDIEQEEELKEFEYLKDEPEPEEEDVIDTKKELANLIRIQRNRITFLLKKEETMPVPFPNLEVMIRECAQMIKELEASQKDEQKEVWEAMFVPLERS